MMAKYQVECLKLACGGTIFNDAPCIFKIKLQMALSGALFENSRGCEGKQ